MTTQEKQELIDRLWIVYCRAVRVEPKTRGTMMSWAHAIITSLPATKSIPDAIMVEILTTLEYCEKRLAKELDEPELEFFKNSSVGNSSPYDFGFGSD